MSAGQSLRRGYAYGTHTIVHSAPTLERRSVPSNLGSLTVLATLILLVTVVASDPVLAASAAKIIGTAWSDILGLLMAVVSRVG
jgi:hypothetical protein